MNHETTRHRHHTMQLVDECISYIKKVVPTANNTPRHGACVPAARSGQSIVYDDPLLKIQDTRYPNNRHHCPLRPNCRDHLCACLCLCPLSIVQLCRAWGVGCWVECLLACLLAACCLLRCCFSTNFPRAPFIRLPSPAAIYRPRSFPKTQTG
jgi:hypothetical protein